jgi:hypothetical protein
MASIDLAFDVTRGVADAVDVGDRRSAKFHDEASHGAVWSAMVGRIGSGKPINRGPAVKGAYT